MNNRRKVIAAITIAALGTTLAFAGHRHHRGDGGWFGGGHGMGHDFGAHRIEKMVHRLDHQLDLTADQKRQLEQLIAAKKTQFKSDRQQHRAMRQQALALNPDSADYDASVQALSGQVAEIARQKTVSMADTYREFTAILTDQQRQELRRMMERRMSRMEERFSGSEDG